MARYIGVMGEKRKMLTEFWSANHFEHLHIAGKIIF